MDNVNAGNGDIVQLDGPSDVPISKKQKTISNKKKQNKKATPSNISDQNHISTAKIHERNSSKTKRKSYEENSAQIGKGGINCPVDGRSKTKSSKTVKVSSTQKSTREVDEKSRGNQNDRGTYQTNMPNLKKNWRVRIKIA